MRINVLIVDDEAYCVQAVQRNVHWDKYPVEHVYCANNAEEAWNLILRERISLLICDIEMPGESGLELIERVREETRLKGKLMECIILTCHPEYHFMRKAMQIGCRDYLLKPLDDVELDRVIGEAVHRIKTELSETNALLDIPEPPLDPAKHDIIAEKILPYIRSNLTNPFTINELARHAALNPQYMMRLFKKSMGTSILDYVTTEKMEMAKELLRKSTWNNEIITEKVGYVSANYFIKLFKKQYGMTPREYRRQLAQGGVS